MTSRAPTRENAEAHRGAFARASGCYASRAETDFGRSGGNRAMRTTVTLDRDVAAAVERLRKERSLGMSEAINELIRAGLVTKQRRARYKHRAQAVGLRVDVTNVSEALELLEGPGRR
jgi:hypothetical protein